MTVGPIWKVDPADPLGPWIERWRTADGAAKDAAAAVLRLLTQAVGRTRTARRGTLVTVHEDGRHPAVACTWEAP